MPDDRLSRDYHELRQPACLADSGNTTAVVWRTLPDSLLFLLLHLLRLLLLLLLLVGLVLLLLLLVALLLLILLLVGLGLLLLLVRFFNEIICGSSRCFVLPRIHENDRNGFGGGGRNANAVLEKPMRGLWGSCIVTANGTVFKKDRRNENDTPSNLGG